MQQVDLYIRNAKDAREAARHASSPKVRDGYIAIAEAWERLANERLAFLQQRLNADGASHHNGLG